MKNIKSIFFVVMILMIFLFNNCKKDETYPLEEGNIYEPVTKGSNWGYSWTWGDYMKDATGDSIQKYEKTYYVKLRTYIAGGYDTTYYAFKDNFYYSLNEKNRVNEYESKYMKNNARVGDSWTFIDKFTGNDRTDIVTVIQTGISYTVKGHTFNNVVQTRTEYGNTGYTVDKYYAKGIGLIKSISESGEDNVEIIDYWIE